MARLAACSGCKRAGQRRGGPDGEGNYVFRRGGPAHRAVRRLRLFRRRVVLPPGRSRPRCGAHVRAGPSPVLTHAGVCAHGRGRVPSSRGAAPVAASAAALSGHSLVGPSSLSGGTVARV